MSELLDEWEASNKKLITNNDDSELPFPDIEDPQLYITKVRKHYMEYLIKLLCCNYETHQKLLNKNIYLPSAIWRCAKQIEMKAAQTCMVVQLYRKNILPVIKELKRDTERSKLHKDLYECLTKPSDNDKKIQTTLSKSNDCSCPCNCNGIKRRKRLPKSPNKSNDNTYNKSQSLNMPLDHQKLPVHINLVTSSPSNFCSPKDASVTMTSNQNVPSITNPTNSLSVNSNDNVSERTQNANEIEMQLEKLFSSSYNDDELFENVLCGTVNVTVTQNHYSKEIVQSHVPVEKTEIENLIQNQAAQIKSLDEKLATLTGLVCNNSITNKEQEVETPKKKRIVSKWLCEEYFLKTKLFELLYNIRDRDRREHARIKTLFVVLFGDDSDDEGAVISPLEDTSEFALSCKERIAPWVTKLLTPYYVKGRIKGKVIFKAVSKHLIKLIYQCSKYPCEFEVTSFVRDFLRNHSMIRCEADFQSFRIDNI